METRKKKRVFRKMWGCAAALGGWLYHNGVTLIVALIGAIPGIWSLSWRISDKRKGEPLSASIKMYTDRELTTSPQGYVPLKISFWNENPFSLILTEIAICNVTNGEVTIGSTRKDIRVDYVLKQHIPPQNFTNVLYEIPPFTLSDRPVVTGTADFEGVFFVSNETLRAGGNVLDFRLTYHGNNRKRKDRTLIVSAIVIEKTPKETNLNQILE